MLWVIASLLFLPVGCSSKSSKPQPVIGLITDSGGQDAAIGMLKGSIYAADPEARITDITHQIDSLNLLEAAFLVSEASREFPEGSIFITLQGITPGTTAKNILVRTKANKYYLAPDNGLLTFVLLREGLDQAWELPAPDTSSPNSATANFLGRYPYGTYAGRLAAGASPESLGAPLQTWEKLNIPKAKYTGKIISGEIIHIDRRGDLVTNIPLDLSEQFVDGKVYRITIGKQTIVAPLVKAANEFPAVGRVLMLYNDADLLEIAVNQGSASRVLKVDATGPVTIQP